MTSDFTTERTKERGLIDSRRVRLREFQTQLVERMQAAQRGAATQFNLLGLVIGQNNYLLELTEAGEIVTAGAITTVPLTQAWYLGLTNIRGNLVSVIDLPAFQGLAPVPREQNTRVVAFAPSLAFNSGLLVSRVLGLRTIEEMDEIHDAPNDLSWVIKQYRDKEGKLWQQLSLSQLIQDTRFLMIGS